jgi:hypothetical protein
VKAETKSSSDEEESEVGDETAASSTDTTSLDPGVFMKTMRANQRMGELKPINDVSDNTRADVLHALMAIKSFMNKEADGAIFAKKMCDEGARGTFSMARSTNEIISAGFTLVSSDTTYAQRIDELICGCGRQDVKQDKSSSGGRGGGYRGKARGRKAK